MQCDVKLEQPEEDTYGNDATEGYTDSHEKVEQDDDEKKENPLMDKDAKEENCFLVTNVKSRFLTLLIYDNTRGDTDQRSLPAPIVGKLSMIIAI